MKNIEKKKGKLLVDSIFFYSLKVFFQIFPSSIGLAFLNPKPFNVPHLSDILRLPVKKNSDNLIVLKIDIWKPNIVSYISFIFRTSLCTNFSTTFIFRTSLCTNFSTKSIWPKVSFSVIFVREFM